MAWRTSTRDGALVAAPQGRIDESNWEVFSADLVVAIAEAGPQGRFVVDLSGVDYMSSRGLRALSTALAAAKIAGVAMSLAAPGETMRQILAISRYDKLFVVHASVAAATG